MIWEYLSSSTAQAIIWLAVAAMLAIIGWKLVADWRARNTTPVTETEVLTEFKKLRRQGVLNDEEYRTIKSNMRGRQDSSAKPDDV